MQQGLLVSAELEFEHAGGTVGIKGQYAAFNDPSATDFSVLGRDVLDLFHLILILQR
jgi:hypothetical protein